MMYSVPAGRHALPRSDTKPGAAADISATDPLVWSFTTGPPKPFGSSSVSSSASSAARAAACSIM
jgi:hypothetical protein